MFLAKCQTSNWCRISFRFLLKKDFTCLCLSVVREEILMSLSYNLWRTFFKPCNSIFAELAATLTRETCISIIILVFLLITVLAPYLALKAGESHLLSTKRSILPRTLASSNNNWRWVTKTRWIAGTINCFILCKTLYD